MDRENQGIVAKKYAKAFIDLFSDKLEFRVPEDIDKLRTFMSYLNDNKKSLFYADLKILSIEKRQNILHNLIDKFGLKAEFKKLTDLLVLHQRIFLLETVIRFILELYLNKINTTYFTLSSSHSISAEQEETLIKFLELKSSKKVIIKSQLDPHLIAGLKAVSTEFEWEHSIRKKLSLLHQT